MEKRPFFRAAMAGLGKYHMGGYGRIGVYRVKTALFVFINMKLVRSHFRKFLHPDTSVYNSIINTHKYSNHS